jgi:hypothetical protein
MIAKSKAADPLAEFRMAAKKLMHSIASALDRNQLRACEDVLAVRLVAVVLGAIETRFSEVSARLASCSSCGGKFERGRCRVRNSNCE